MSQITTPGASHDAPEASESTEADVAIESQAVLPPKRSMPYPNYRVYGFLVNDDVLLDYALRSRLGTDENEMQRNYVIGMAAALIADDFGIYPFLIAGVWYNGKARTCVAIASEDFHDHMLDVNKETVEKLKKMFHTQRPPRWFTHV